MILDPTDRFIAHVLRHCDLADKVILEVGCGRGRVTRDLARHARRVVAIDPDETALERARETMSAGNVEFICGKAEALPLPERSFDLVVYSLSLHHLPPDSMRKSLLLAGRLLTAEGVIVVIEPGDNGTLIEAEETFDVGDGNEREAKKAAQAALSSLAGWTLGEPVCFTTLFHVEGVEDFLDVMKPGWRRAPGRLAEGLASFLECRRIGDRIVLDADRRMYVLKRRLPEEGWPLPTKEELA